VSYRDHAVPTVLKLRDAGYKLGVASKGRAVKQWQKLIQLGLEHVFHAVTVSEETGSERLTTDTLSRTLERLGNVKPELSVFVGSDLTKEIALANAVKMTTARIKTGAHRTSTPKAPDEKPAFEISKLSDILEILRTSK
jgi:putative hydrolase of the HAD superfamily